METAHIMESEWERNDAYRDVLALTQTGLEEKDRVLGMKEAVAALEEGAQVAFYDLHLLAQEQQALAQNHINGYHNIPLTLSEAGILQETLMEIVPYLFEGENHAGDMAHIAYLLFRITSNLLSATGTLDAELIIRTEPAMMSDGTDGHGKETCHYWHVDKSHGEIAAQAKHLSHPIGEEMEQYFFLLSLRGETTLFQPVAPEQRKAFFHMANETEYFYGHSAPEYCIAKGGIDALLPLERAVRAEAGYGSVHIAGRHGTVHTAPTGSQHARMLLLITPFRASF